MPRFIAFLRAINVGGRVVAMAKLRSLFESLGFSSVETFIASGNVIFESKSTSEKSLRTKIERCLKIALGYDVTTFLRTDVEVAAAADHEAFPADILKQAAALNVAFVSTLLSAATQQAIKTFRTDIDEFHVNGREVYWMCRVRQSDSKFSAAAFERAIGQPATFRNINTVRKLTAKYPPRGNRT